MEKNNSTGKRKNVSKTLAYFGVFSVNGKITLFKSRKGKVTLGRGELHHWLGCPADGKAWRSFVRKKLIMFEIFAKEYAKF